MRSNQGHKSENAEMGVPLETSFWFYKVCNVGSDVLPQSDIEDLMWVEMSKFVFLCVTLVCYLWPTIEGSDFFIHIS